MVGLSDGAGNAGTALADTFVAPSPVGQNGVALANSLVQLGNFADYCGYTDRNDCTARPLRRARSASVCEFPMQKPSMKPRNRRVLLPTGGLLVLASAAGLAQWAWGEPSEPALPQISAASGETARPSPSVRSAFDSVPAATPTANGAAAVQPPGSRYVASETPSESPTGEPAPASGSTLAIASTQQPTPQQSSTEDRPQPTADSSKPSGAGGATNAATIKLQNLPAAELRPRLETLLGRQLATDSDASGQWQTFSVEAGGAPVMIAVNSAAGEVRLAGAEPNVASWRTIIEALDSRPTPEGFVTHVRATRPGHEPFIRRALANFITNNAAARGTAAAASLLLQQQVIQQGRGGFPPPTGAANQPFLPPGQGESQAATGSPGALSAIEAASARGVLGPVQVSFIEGANIVIITGQAADVERVQRIIAEIERITQTTTPEVVVYPLQHVNSAALAALVGQVYGDAFAPRMGNLFVHALGSPNAILLVGPTANVNAAIERIIRPLDQPVPPQTLFEVFRLQHAPAAAVKTTVDAFLRQDAAGPTTAPNDLLPGNITPQLAPRAIVVADTTTNSLIVAAAPRDIAQIAELLRRIDAEPSIAATLKVYDLQNADAAAILETLQALFGTGQAAVAGQQQTGIGVSGIVPMQFSIDGRTNSIIVVGTPQQVATVESIIYTLDQGDARQRETRVYRLKNSFANAVSNALNLWIQQERGVYQTAQVIIATTEALRREVVVVAEPATNNLIVSTAPENFIWLEEMINDLDQPPPMVLIQVLIAEVRLTDTDEFGVELGLQDSLLFDRSNVSSFQTVETTINTPSASGGTVQTQQQSIIDAVGEPGFNFNNPGVPLGNNLSTTALAAASHVATQGLSHFAVGRINNELGFGGFVFSAQSSGVSVLLRALQEKRRLEVLSRPQIMALDAQPSILQVGQNVPTITSTSLTQFGQVNSITYTPVGLILNLVPLISLADNKVVITITANKSEVGAETEGIPISISTEGQILRAPRIENTTAFSTVSAMDGQTIVLGGLLTTRKLDVHRRVPLIADIPLIGDLFRFDSVGEERRELLIILTPRIVRKPEDAERLKQIESSRMSWVLGDVVALNGPASGLRSRCDEWYESEVGGVYPTYIPQEGELCPTCEPNAIPIEGPLTPIIQPSPASSLPYDLPRATSSTMNDPSASGYSAGPAGVSQARYDRPVGQVSSTRLPSAR
jgi:type II secretion system protein D